MSNNYGPRIVTDGLVLCLDAADRNSYDGTSGTWYDLSGNENNSSLGVGSLKPSFSNSNGGIFGFDTDYIEQNFSSASIISNPSLNNMNLSINFWCKVKTSSSYYIISSGGQTGSTGIAFSYQAGNPFFTIHGEDVSAIKYFNVSHFPLNTWINWCLVSNDSSFILYKNGSLLDSSSFTSNSYSTVYNSLTIGKPNNAFSYYAAMDFANLTIYDIPLDNFQVQQNFEATKGRFGL